MLREFLRKRLVPAGNAHSIRAEGKPPNRVLLVEHHGIQRSRTSVMLALLGCRVTVVSSSAQALERAAFAGAGFDALVTDLSLPGLSGQELASALQEQFPELAVLFLMRSIDDPADWAEPLDAQSRQLCKPFTVEQLEQELSAFTDEVIG